ncbi:hypothetical protein ACOSQ4_013448 [Xanthoceras sorbifolium]
MLQAYYDFGSIMPQTLEAQVFIKSELKQASRKVEELKTSNTPLRADVDCMTESNREAKKTVAEASTKALVLGNENINLKEETEKLKETKGKSSEWDPNIEITALKTYLKANEGDAPAQDMEVEADLPVGSTDLPSPDLALGDDEIVDDTEKTTSMFKLSR